MVLVQYPTNDFAYLILLSTITVSGSSGLFNVHITKDIVDRERIMNIWKCIGCSTTKGPFRVCDCVCKFFFDD